MVIKPPTKWEDKISVGEQQWKGVRGGMKSVSVCRTETGIQTKLVSGGLCLVCERERQMDKLKM